MMTGRFAALYAAIHDLTPRRMRPAALALAGLLAAGRAGARDLSCSEYGSGKTDLGWIHGLPERAKLPPVETVEQLGGLLLLDEVLYSGGDACIYSKIAEAGSRESFDQFGSDWVFSGWGRALIRGRIQRPDGTVRELTGDDIQCSTVGEGALLSNEGTSKQYVIHFPELGPGTLVQSQIKRPCSTSPSFFPAWEGTGDHPRMPAAEVRTLINVAQGQDFLVKVYPAGAPVQVSDLPSAGSGSKKLILITSRRPAIPEEPYQPWVYYQSPLVMVRDVSNPTVRNFSWGDLVNLQLGALDSYTRNSAAALEALYAEARISAALPAWERIRRVHAYLRDQVSDEPAGLSRNSSYRPLINIVSQARTATPFEKMAAEIALLRTMGYKAWWAYARENRQQPIDREQPDMDWFNDTFVVLEFEGRQWFLDPVRRLAFGELPDSVQGGEGMLIRSRSDFEWISLPFTPVEDNRVDAELTVTAGAGAALAGTARFTLRNSNAYGLRGRLEESSPDEVRSRLESWLSERAAAGVTYSNIRYENLYAPDEPLILTADFEYLGAVVAAGRRAYVGLLPVRMGPTADSFIAEQRVQDIDFGIPASTRTVLRIPRRLFTMPAAPDAVRVAGPGVDYRRSAAFEGADLAVTRELTLGGLIKRERYAELRDAMRKVADADQAPLMVTR